MKKLILVVLCLSLSGCLSANVTGYGILATDPGVRVYKSDKVTYINITHKKGQPAPDYERISLIIKQVCK